VVIVNEDYWPGSRPYLRSMPSVAVIWAKTIFGNWNALSWLEKWKSGIARIRKPALADIRVAHLIILIEYRRVLMAFSS